MLSWRPTVHPLATLSFGSVARDEPPGLSGCSWPGGSPIHYELNCLRVGQVANDDRISYIEIGG
jgi:hypothetical protein